MTLLAAEYKGAVGAYASSRGWRTNIYGPSAVGEPGEEGVDDSVYARGDADCHLGNEQVVIGCGSARRAVKYQ